MYLRLRLFDLHHGDSILMTYNKQDINIYIFYIAVIEMRRACFVLICFCHSVFLGISSPGLIYRYKYCQHFNLTVEANDGWTICLSLLMTWPSLFSELLMKHSIVNLQCSYISMVYNDHISICWYVGIAYISMAYNDHISIWWYSRIRIHFYGTQRSHFHLLVRSEQHTFLWFTMITFPFVGTVRTAYISVTYNDHISICRYGQDSIHLCGIQWSHFHLMVRLE